jgi:Zn-dependent protease
MRDPMTWAFPVARLFGVTVRIHILYPLIALGLILRAGADKSYPSGAWLETTVLFLMLLVIVICHEFGHIFGARYVDGDGEQILIWPLGGLAYVDVPNTPRAHLITAWAGPMVNVILCVAVAAGLAVGGFVAPLNPFTNPLDPKMHNWREGAVYSRYGPPQTGEGEIFLRVLRNPELARDLEKLKKQLEEERQRPSYVTTNEATGPRGVAASDVIESRLVLANRPEVEVRPAVLPLWARLSAQFYLLSAWLFLFNLLPAFPLDGGRIFQALLWARTDYRQATTTAVTVGSITALVMLVVAFIYNEALLLGLALFMYISCRQQLMLLEAGVDETGLGYDFSQGYTSLERGEPPPPRPKRLNFIQRWLQQRAARRLQREAEQREHDEARTDALLEKIAREGKESLTDEERRFLKRVSDQYRRRT